MPVESGSPPACRPRCGACCIAPSISTPLPWDDGGPDRPKPAGVACPQLDDDLRCRLFGNPRRPAVCTSLAPEPAMCGASGTQALQWLQRMEVLTNPNAQER